MRRLFFLPAALLFSACTVGPEFTPPPKPSVETYDVMPLPTKLVSTPRTGGETQYFKPGTDIPAKWWALFQSEALNELIEDALHANPDLQAAEASLREAQETAAAAGGSLWPRVDGRTGISGNQTSNSSGGSLYTLYNASVDVSYDLDLFGGNKRRVEAAEAEAEIRRYQMEAAYLALTSNVVTTALQEAALRAQLDASRQIIAEEKKRLDVLNRQFAAGGIARDAILEQESTIAQSLTAIPPLEKQLAQARNLLATLTGRFPSEGIDSQFTIEAMTLPVEIPISLPSKLVEERPDVRAAEAALHSAAANAGVAAANRLPQINLTASLGTQATQLGSLFSTDGLAWNVGAGLLQPIFRGGELEHANEAALAGYEAAAARYRSAVLNAFRDVADSLRALQADTDYLNAQDEAVRTTIARRETAERQFRLGAGSHLAVLTAQQAYENSKIAMVQAKARRFSNVAALFQALGGGWIRRDFPIPRAPTVEQQYDLLAHGVKKMGNRNFASNTTTGGMESQPNTTTLPAVEFGPAFHAASATLNAAPQKDQP